MINENEAKTEVDDEFIVLINENRTIKQMKSEGINEEKIENRQVNAKGNNNTLTVSKEGDILIQSIKANILDIRNNIEQVYSNISTPQIRKPIINMNNHRDSLNNEIKELTKTITTLQIENQALREEIIQLKKADSKAEKKEVIKYQKKYLAEMKEIETYLALVTEGFLGKLEQGQREKKTLMNIKEENSAYINKLLKEKVNLGKKMTAIAEVYQNNINVLKHKLKTIKHQYENKNEHKCHCNYTFLKNTADKERIDYMSD